MLTPTGYENKTLSTILEEQRRAFETTIDPYVNLLPEEILGQLRDIFSKGLKDAYDMGQSINASLGLGASGISLDINARLIGKIRKQATKSRIKDYKVVTDAANVTITAGTMFRSSLDPDIEFEAIETELLVSAGTHRINLIAVDAGSISVSTGEISIIATPIAGLSTGENDVTAVFINGTDLETDDELRLRMFQTPVIARTLRVDAIRNAVLDLNDVADIEGFTAIAECKIIENVESITINGMPRNSVQAVIYYAGSADAETDTRICEALSESVADGIKTVATATNTYEESITVGNSIRTMRFSRADEVEPYIIVDTIPALTAGQKTDLKADISDFLDTFSIGQDLRAFGKTSLSDIVNDFSDVDITDYDIFIGLTSAPITDDPITVDDLEIIKYNAARVSIGDK